jgi:hypothetical protein
VIEGAFRPGSGLQQIRISLPLAPDSCQLNMAGSGAASYPAPKHTPFGAQQLLRCCFQNGHWQPTPDLTCLIPRRHGGFRGQLSFVDFLHFLIPLPLFVPLFTDFMSPSRNAQPG